MRLSARRTEQAGVRSAVHEYDAYAQDLRAELARLRTELDFARGQLAGSLGFDRVTGLPSRALALDRLDAAIELGRRQQTTVAVLVVAVDDFGDVVDGVGPARADQVLAQFAKRMGSSVRASDTVARLGDDQFLVTLPVVAVAEDATVVAEEIQRSLTHSFVVDGSEVFLRCSIGIASAPNDGFDADRLVRHAGLAVRGAKAEGGSRSRYYSATIGRSARERFAFETSLRHAAERDELALRWAPVIDSRTSAVVAVHATVWWRTAKQGLVPTARFASAIEHKAVAEELDRWFVRTAAAEIRRARRDGAAVPSAVLSGSARAMRTGALGDALATDAADLLDGVAVAVVVPCAGDTATVPSGVHVVLGPGDRGLPSLAALDASSFGSVAIGPPIVREFLSPTAPTAKALVRSVVHAATELELGTMAFGVDTPEQRDALAALGLVHVQGNAAGRPAASVAQATGGLPAV